MFQNGAIYIHIMGPIHILALEKICMEPGASSAPVSPSCLNAADVFPFQVIDSVCAIERWAVACSVCKGVVAPSVPLPPLLRAC